MITTSTAILIAAAAAVGACIKFASTTYETDYCGSNKSKNTKALVIIITMKSNDDETTATAIVTLVVAAAEEIHFIYDL